MRIATRIRVSALLMAGLTLVIGAAALITFQTVRESFQDSAFVDRIRSDAFELNTLTLDFLMNGGERGRTQWLSKYRQMEAHWNDRNLSHPDQAELFQKLQRNHADLMAIFPMLAEHVLRADGAGGAPADNAFVARFSNQILLRVRVMVSAAERMEIMSKAHVAADLRRAVWIILAIGGVAVITALLICVGIQRSLVRPLVRLHRAANDISNGHLDRRIGIRAPDEIGALSAAFDEMAEALLRTTVSRDRLRAEIDRHRETTRSLVDSEERFRAIAAAAHDAIILMDDTGAVTYWNAAAVKIFGYSGEEILGRDLHEKLAPPRHRKEFLAAFDTFAATGSGAALGRALDLSALRKDGAEFPVELSLSAVLLNGRWSAVGIVRDMTEKKAVEARLRHSEKMESIGHLAGGIAHDFNNILYAAMGYTEMALEHAEKGSTQERCLKEVFSATKRAKELVLQILTFARKGNDSLRPVQIDIIVREALDLIRATIPTSIEICRRMDSGSMVMADPTQLHQVVINLCANAAQAMEAAPGVLTVSLFDLPATSSPPADLAPGDYVALRVADTGEGIPPDVIGAIFDPYFTTKETGKGTGLGLAVVHGIARSAGGAVTVQSEPGRGSVFTVYLPALKSASPSSPAYSAAETPAGGQESGERILVVDDEATIVEMLRRRLVLSGYAVTGLTSSVEALARFRADPEAFDLVITDMTMPAMTGDRLAQEMIRIRPDLPVILCTGYNARVSEERAAEIGVAAFVMKPISGARMEEAARAALNMKGKTKTETSIFPA